MAAENRSWKRQREAFWRAHHEAWKRSDLNQQQYCEALAIPLKAFGNWRAMLKAEPQRPERKLLYRRRVFSHPVSPPLSPPRNHPSSPVDLSLMVVGSSYYSAAPRGSSAAVQRSGQTPDTRRSDAARRRCRRGGAPLWHRPPCSASMEARLSWCSASGWLCRLRTVDRGRRYHIGRLLGPCATQVL